ncbi:MAG: putative ABC transporter permease subunit [Ruminococcus sp.]|jgi:ABC-2 type transport system permease protein
MFKALFQSEVLLLLSSLFRSSGKKKPGIALKVGMGILGVYVIGCLFFLFAMISAALCLPLHQAGLDWFYFSLMGGISILLNIVGGIFASKTVLFDAKDNELLLSMPIQPLYILMSRMLTLLLLAYLWQAFVLIPAYVVYGFFAGFSAASFFSAIVIFLLLPLISITINALLGWLLAVLSARLPFKHLVSVVLYVAFFALYFYGYSRISSYIQWMTEHGTGIAETVRKTLFPIYHLGAAAGEGSMFSLLLFVICAAVPFAVMMWILSRSFFYITATKKGRIRKKYRENEVHVSSVDMALLKKELRYFGTNSMYMINASTGTVFMLILIVFAVIKIDALHQFIGMIPGRFAGYVGGAAALALASLVSFNIMSAPSISVEGKNLWISQSLPVEPVRILMAKVNMHVVTGGVPVCVAALVLNIILPMDWLSRILVFLLPLCFNLAVGFLGVIVNLRFPKLEWSNETAAVKQGLSPFLTLLLAVVLIGAPVFGYIMLAVAGMSWGFLMLVHCMILLASSAGMYFYLKEGGSRRFTELQR